jgi:hypothetical protein
MRDFIFRNDGSLLWLKSRRGPWRERERSWKWNDGQIESVFDSGWWFGTFGLFFHIICWECHHPNWRTHIFSEGWVHHQPVPTRKRGDWCWSAAWHPVLWQAFIKGRNMYYIDPNLAPGMVDSAMDSANEKGRTDQATR